VKSIYLALVSLASFAALQGCASDAADQQLEQAEAVLQAVNSDPQILGDAPVDVERAQDSIERARRFAGYWGSAQDVEHYAYLSRRYSEIARQHSEALRNRERVTRLSMEHERLRQAVQDAKSIALHPSVWPEDQLISLAAAETDRGMVMTLGDVLFAAGSAEPRASASPTLIKLARFLRLNPQRRIRIEGYTDNRGDADVNLALSQARAQAVADFIHSLGVDAGRLEAVGYGEQYRVAENASARGRAQNRRVEILLSDEAGRLASPR